MSAIDIQDLTRHAGHKLNVVTYGYPVRNVAIECETCYEVIIDFDKDQPHPPTRKRNGKEESPARPVSV